jgi:uncharacterized membrane protein
MFDIILALIIALYRFIIGASPLEALQYGSSWLPIIVKVVYFTILSFITMAAIISAFSKKRKAASLFMFSFVIVFIGYFISIFFANKMMYVFAEATTIENVNWSLVVAILAARFLTDLFIKSLNKVFKSNAVQN